MIYTAYFTETRLPAMNVAVGDFVSRLCFGAPGCFDRFASMGVFDDGSLIGGTVYHNWQQGSGVIELSSAATSRRWLQPHVIRAMFSFPFDGMSAQMVGLRVSENNSGMISIARRFGFDGYFIPRLRGRNEGEWIFTLTEEAWRSHPVAMRAKIV